MSDTNTAAPAPQQQSSAPANQEAAPNRLQALKKRADLMGIEYSNNIGEEALSAKINAKLNNETTKEEPKQETSAPTVPNPVEAKPEAVKEAPKANSREAMIADAMRLVRVRIQCMNPAKAKLQGEVFSVANEMIGNVRKFVPFGEFTDNGFHVPNVILKMMKRRRFLQISEKKSGPGNTPQVTSRYVREFSIEELPPLTAQELKDLATAQLASGSIDYSDEEQLM